MLKKVFPYLIFAILLVINILSLEIYADYLSYQQMAKAAYIVIGAYCTYMSLRTYSNYTKFQRLLLCFYLLLLATSPFSRHFNQIYSCSFVLLSYYVGFNLSANGSLNNKKWLLLLGCISAIVLYDFYTQLTYIVAARGFDNMGGQNVSYKIVGLMILASVFLKDIKAAALIGLYFILVLFCFKKGAVVCGLAVVCVVLYYHFRENKKYMPYAVGLFAVGAYYVISNLEFFFRRFFDYSNNYGDNARDIMYSKILDEWLNTSFFQFLFGGGFFHASDINYFGGTNNDGFYAHSDYYEMISDYGAIGIVFYLILLYNAYKSTKITTNPYLRYIQYPLLAVWFSKAYFSGVYTTFAGYFILLTLGFIHGKDTYEKNNLLYSQEFAN